MGLLNILKRRLKKESQDEDLELSKELEAELAREEPAGEAGPEHQPVLESAQAPAPLQALQSESAPLPPTPAPPPDPPAQSPASAKGDDSLLDLFKKEEVLLSDGVASLADEVGDVEIGDLVRDLRSLGQEIGVPSSAPSER